MKAEAILNGALIIDLAHRFFKAIWMLGMETKFSMLELVKATPSTVAMA